MKARGYSLPAAISPNVVMRNCVANRIECMNGFALLDLDPTTAANTSTLTDRRRGLHHPPVRVRGELAMPIAYRFIRALLLTGAAVSFTAPTATDEESRAPAP